MPWKISPSSVGAWERVIDSVHPVHSWNGSQMTDGRLAAAWFDSMEPGTLDPGRPLHAVDALQVTPRVASTTRESRIRSAWTVARRIDLILQPMAARGKVSERLPDDLADLAGDAGPG